MKRVILAVPLLILGGCVVRARPAVVEVEAPRVHVEAAPVEVVAEPVAPVIEGGIAVDILPPPAERVYIYEPGYPPGCFLVGGFVYYGGHRYERNIFHDRFVRANIEHRRFVDVEYNRRVGRTIEVRHRENFQHYGNHYSSHPRPAEEHHRTH